MSALPESLDLLAAATSQERGQVARRLTVFTRYPQPGTAKTRLIPALGPDGAARLQCDLTRRALARARQLRELVRAEVEVRFEGGDPDKMAAGFGRDLSYVPQGPGDLGRRLERAFEESFAKVPSKSSLSGRIAQVSRLNCCGKRLTSLSTLIWSSVRPWTVGITWLASGAASPRFSGASRGGATAFSRRPCAGLDNGRCGLGYWRRSVTSTGPKILRFGISSRGTKARRRRANNESLS